MISTDEITTSRVFCTFDKNLVVQTISFQIPALAGISELDARIILAGELYQREKVSLGQAADIAGLSKRTFIEIIGKYGFSIFSESIEDFRNDLKNAWKQ